MASKKINKNTPWFTTYNNKFKVFPEFAVTCGITTDYCTICTDILISNVYQMKLCGSRCCQHCFKNLEAKYYCLVCANDDPDNMIHNKKDIYEDKALMKDLEKMKLTCPDCKSTIQILDLENHSKKCTEGWIYCNNCEIMVKKIPGHECESQGSESIKAIQLKYRRCEFCGKECEDLEKHESICPNNWKKFGCQFGCSVNTNMEQHRQDQALFHLDQAWAVLKAHKLTGCADESSSEFKDLLENSVDRIRKSINLDMNVIQTLSKELKNLNETMMIDSSISESLKSSITVQMADTLSTSFDGTIVWRIDGFNEIRSRAKNESQKSIFSPPFYTSRFGYKMCLRLYPNGDSTAWNVAMSLFLVIMKGNYDSLLTWPFKQKVTFVLLDQDFKCNMIDAFVPSDNAASFSRPRTDMNVPSGSSFFIKFEDMKLRKYIKDDTIFIRCIIDCSDLH